MPDNYRKTLDLLATSKNRSAARLLDAALRSSFPGIQRSACQKIITTRGSHGMTELIRQFDTFDQVTLDYLADYGEKLVGAIRSALLSGDEQLRANGYQATLTLKIVEMIPDLLTIYHDQHDHLEKGSPLSETILTLMDTLRDMIQSRRRRRYLINVVLTDITRVMNELIRIYRRNDPPLILQAFLEFYPYIYDLSPFLAETIRNPTHPCYLPIARLLQQSREPFVFRFMNACLDGPDPPPLVLSSIVKRDDLPFLQALCQKIEEGVTDYFKENIGKVKRFEWFGNIRAVLDHLDESCQPGLVELVAMVPQPPEQRRALLTLMMAYAKPAGRRAVIPYLGQIPGEAVDKLLLQAVDDNDPEVQIAAMEQVKTRNIPGAAFLILQHAESPHEIVRQAIQELLPEFRFNRFWELFDQLNEEQRRTSIKLIRKIDPQFVAQLTEILQIGKPTEKAKAMLCLDAWPIPPQIEDALCMLLLNDENAALRTRAAVLLAEGRREASRNSLVQAFHRDPNSEVRAAARASLERRPAPWSLQKEEGES